MAGAFTIPLAHGALHGETRGDDPVTVLLHGFGGEMRDWDRLWAQLPTNMPLLRYDLRGFGRSTAKDGPFSHADDLLRLLDARGIEQANLVGVSAGGAVALNFALGHPSRVGRLVLVSPAIVGWEWSAEWQRLWRELTDAARSGDITLARRLWWEHPLLATVRQSEAAGELREAIERYPGGQWVKDWQRDELPDVDRLHELRPPALLLTGERDLPDFRLIADIVAAMAPDVRRIDIADAGHMLHLERPRELAAAITNFLSPP